MSKEFTVAFQGVLGNTRLLVRFQDGCEKNLSANQLTIVIVENILEEKESEVFVIPEIPEEQVKLWKGYYFCVYAILWCKEEVGVDSKYRQVDVEDDPDEKEMDDVNIDNDR